MPFNEAREAAPFAFLAFTTRRQWICASAAMLALGGGLEGFAQEARSVDGAAGAQSTNDKDEEREIAEVRVKGGRAGLDRFSAVRSDHFLAIGDASERFSREALDICEKLSAAYLSEFTAKGFSVKLPDHRLTVVILKDHDSYSSYAGEAVASNVGGHYDVETNRLVVFDFRPKAQDLEAAATRVNLLSLVHEATHLLCFNTGLLSRQSDFPDCISEGIATYTELWRRSDKLKLGGSHPYRKLALKNAGETDLRWIKIARLFTNDDLFSDQDTEQLAYAESWLLVHYYMHTPAQLPKFREYLNRLKTATDQSKRRQLAEECLGPLDKLDKPIGAHAAKVK
jgi:hypothetical protein